MPLSSPRLRATALLIGLACARPAAADDLPAAPVDSAPGGNAASLDAAGVDDLLDMDLDQLSNASVSVAVESFDETVTSVTRQESTVGMSPAAVYVITNDMIRRSGVRSVPEALRLAPGLHVAKIDSNKWAIAVRGFNDQYTKKLLVQIDGRTVYSAQFGGVYWDVQDLLLEDIERIEVVRGPGATVWGSNAVNGVINILTKSARDTTGAYAIVGGGTYEEGFAGARLGGVAAGGDLAWRVFGKWFERDTGYRPDFYLNDEWGQGRGGFRMDWTPTCADTLTLQGEYFEDVHSDAYRVGGVPVPYPDSTASGGHLLMRWSRQTGADSGWSAQFFWDRNNRQSITFGQQLDVYDFDLQHHFRWADRQSLVWGLGYRMVSDELTASPGGSLSYVPNSLNYDLPSCFVQNQTELAEDRLLLTVGVKLEHNVFSHLETQPSIRLLWALDERRAAWGAVSRAVRVPTRDEDTIFLPIPPSFLFVGNPNLDAEDLMAYEFGYRAQPNEYFSWDLAAFYNVYDNLITTVFATFPVIGSYNNNTNAQGYGLELSGKVEMTESWRLSGHYSFLRLDIDTGPENLLGGAYYEQSSPRNQALLWSSWDVACDWEVDLIARYVDSLPSIDIDSYIAMDLRVGWRPSEALECSVVAQNLLDAAHGEYRGGGLQSISTDARRGVYGALQWRY